MRITEIFYDSIVLNGETSLKHIVTEVEMRVVLCKVLTELSFVSLATEALRAEHHFIMVPMGGVPVQLSGL